MNKEEDNIRQRKKHLLTYRTHFSINGYISFQQIMPTGVAQRLSLLTGVEKLLAY